MIVSTVLEDNSEYLTWQVFENVKSGFKYNIKRRYKNPKNEVGINLPN